MIAGLDSSTGRPTVATIAAARAAGVRVWGGYLATRPQVGLESPWDLQSFEIAHRLGSMPIAFSSGWDDPQACRWLAASWRVRLCLDVEDGIRPDGVWVQDWLDASGAGLYGLDSVHPGRRAAFHIVARYPGFDPLAAWDWRAGPRPPTPCGWQWQGTHIEQGLEVDSLWLDEWFGGDPPKEVHVYLVQGDQDAAPSGSGAIYVTNWIWKRHVLTPAEVQALQQFLGALQQVPQALIDAVPAS